MKLKIEITECNESPEHVGFETTLDDTEVYFYRKYKEITSEVPQMTYDVKPVGEVMTLITSNIPRHILQKITDIMNLYVNGDV